MKQPIIGVICKHLMSSPSPHHTSGMVRDEIVAALLAQSAIPIGINPIKHSGTIESITDIKRIQESADFKAIIPQIELCDGLIFQGGQSINPMEYGIAEYAYTHDVPCLGFCAGQTVMAKVVAPHLTVIRPAGPSHDSEDDYAHSITIDPGSRFYSIIGQDTLLVNSRHTKSIVTCPVFHNAAKDPDDNIEVLESPTKKFYLATRFHPESLYLTDKNMRKIFTAFIDACLS